MDAAVGTAIPAAREILAVVRRRRNPLLDALDLIVRVEVRGHGEPLE